MDNIGKFKVGDRVIYRFTNSLEKSAINSGFGDPMGYSFLDGHTGTIVYIVIGYNYVHFDKRFPHGHTCNNRIPDGYGYAVGSEFLHLIDNDIENKTIRWYKNGKLSGPECVEEISDNYI